MKAKIITINLNDGAVAAGNSHAEIVGPWSEMIVENKGGKRSYSVMSSSAP